MLLRTNCDHTTCCFQAFDLSPARSAVPLIARVSSAGRRVTRLLTGHPLSFLLQSSGFFSKRKVAGESTGSRITRNN